MESRTGDDQRFGELMRGAQAGDADAYRTLLQELAPRLRRIVRRRRGTAAPADVEDLVQDILLSLHVARDTYDPGRPFLPWMLAIVRNRLADGARRFARRAAHEVAVEEYDVTFTQPATNSSSGLAGDAGALRRAVQSLPARQRQAIELLKLQELSLKEAAAVTGSSVEAQGGDSSRRRGVTAPVDQWWGEWTLTI